MQNCKWGVRNVGWSNQADEACRYANIADLDAQSKFPGWSSVFNCHDDFVFTAPVGSFQANAWGLKDMTGNVSEWTCSGYESNYSGKEKQCNNKVSDSLGRVVRGGSWIDLQNLARASFRYSFDPDYRYYFIGIRVCCLSPIMNTGH